MDFSLQVSLHGSMISSLKGTVQQKLTRVISYIRRQVALNRWYFIFKIKGNLIFKLQKTV